MRTQDATPHALHRVRSANAPGAFAILRQSGPKAGPTLRFGQHFAQLPGQILAAEGLGQKVDAGVQHTVVHHGILGVPGEEHGFGLGTGRLNPVGQLPAAHVGHYHVGEQQVDVPGVRLADLNRFRAAGRRQNGIAKLLQNPHGEFAHRLFVFHYQDGLATAPPG